MILHREGRGVGAARIPYCAGYIMRAANGKVYKKSRKRYGTFEIKMSFFLAFSKLAFTLLYQSAKI